MDSLIKVKNLHLSFGSRVILKNISFEVQRGEVFTILGGSGSGKTTITKCIVGLLKPSAGDIIVFGRSILSLSPIELDEYRKKVGYLFQNSALFDSLRVWENVVFYHLEHSSYSAKELKSLALEKLRMVGLNQEHMDLFPAELSGGMKKRVALARALATNPELIIYDEPTSGLDPINSRLIDELILSTRERTMATSIVVTHDMVSALSISDRIMVLKDGEIMQIGTPSEVFSSSIEWVRKFVSMGLKDGL
ncbi:MAG: ABC transporter ATP-binding protein [Aquificaceae bacterium]